VESGGGSAQEVAYLMMINEGKLPCFSVSSYKLSEARAGAIRGIEDDAEVTILRKDGYDLFMPLQKVECRRNTIAEYGDRN
jgi:hypothetical protein